MEEDISFISPFRLENLFKLSYERETAGFPRVRMLYDDELGDFRMYVCMSSVYPHLLIHYFAAAQSNYSAMDRRLGVKILRISQ